MITPKTETTGHSETSLFATTLGVTSQEREMFGVKTETRGHSETSLFATTLGVTSQEREMFGVKTFPGRREKTWGTRI